MEWYYVWWPWLTFKCVARVSLHQLSFLVYPCAVVSAIILLRQLGGWLGGWVSVTRRYCIRMAKTILKLFRPPVSAFILVSSDPCVDTLSKGNPFSGGFKYTGVGKIGVIRRISPLSRKRCEIGRWLPCNVNRKSWVLDWMV